MEFDGQAGVAAVVRPEVEQQMHDGMTESVSKSVTDMLIRIEGELDRADSQIGEKMHVLDQDNDGALPPRTAAGLATRPSLFCCCTCVCAVGAATCYARVGSPRGRPCRCCGACADVVAATDGAWRVLQA